MIKATYSSILLLLFFNLTVWSDVKQKIELKSEKKLVVTFLDVGQGDSILIKTPNENYGLIDTGKGNSILDSLYEYTLPNQKINFLVITHPDADHMEGALEIINRFKVEMVFINGNEKENELIQQFKNSLTFQEIDSYSLRYYNDFNLDGVNFDIIWPEEKSPEDSSIDPNDLSISMKFSYQNCNIISMGDLSSEFELKAISNIKEDSPVEILKVSHHGSKTSSSIDVLQKIKPKIGVIQSGRGNSYGHPHQEVLETLSSLGIETLRNDDLGDIGFEIENNEINYGAQKRINCI